MNRPSEELLHKTLENRATAAEAASVAEWLATDSGQAWASRYIGRDFDRQESCGDYEREEVASERIFARIKTALTRSRRRRILFRVAAVVIPVALVLGVALRLDLGVFGEVHLQIVDLRPVRLLEADDVGRFRTDHLQTGGAPRNPAVVAVGAGLVIADVERHQFQVGLRSGGGQRLVVLRPQGQRKAEKRNKKQ